MRALLLSACLAVSSLAIGSTGCLFVGTHHVANSGWVELGERWVDGRADHDAIGVGRADGRYTHIQVAVENSALEMYNITVTFGDGQRWSPTTRLVFGAGTTSRQIDLPGGARVIRRVDFQYGNLPGGGRAHVVLYGD